MVKDKDVICPVCGFTMENHSDEIADICLDTIHGWMAGDIMPEEPKETTTD